MLTIPLMPLESGLLTKVDTGDFWDLADFDWKLFVGKYAGRPSTKYGTVYLHRQIMGLLDEGRDVQVDHINGDGLDNRRRNLRVCSASQNRRNSFKPRHCCGRPTVSQYKGVSATRDSAGNPWTAGILSRRIGYFATEIEAAHAYDDAARAEFGEFARLNFPRDGEQSARPASAAVA